MRLDAETLLRYLRQRRELGEREWLLDRLDAQSALRALTSAVRGDVAAAAPARDATALAQPPVAPAEAAAGTGTEEASVAAANGPPTSSAAALEALAAEASGCTRCRLCETRRSVVFGEGSWNADVVVVGEAPGGEEDRTGRPFVGPAGKLLDLLLLSAGFPRERVYICNVLKCRPPRNRDPMADEVASCTPYLRRQIELIEPQVLLAVGRFAGQTLLDTDESMGRMRGQVRTYRGVPVIATYHPAYLLRSPRAVRAAWQDFQLLRSVFDEQG